MSLKEEKRGRSVEGTGESEKEPKKMENSTVYGRGGREGMDYIKDEQKKKKIRINIEMRLNFQKKRKIYFVRNYNHLHYFFKQNVPFSR